MAKQKQKAKIYTLSILYVYTSLRSKFIHSLNSRRFDETSHDLDCNNLKRDLHQSAYNDLICYDGCDSIRIIDVWKKAEVGSLSMIDCM